MLNSNGHLFVKVLAIVVGILVMVGGGLFGALNNRVDKQVEKVLHLEGQYGVILNEIKHLNQGQAELKELIKEQRND